MTAGDQSKCEQVTLEHEGKSMSNRNLLESLLQSGQDLAQRGQKFAEKQLGVPESGAERDQALSNLGKGAAVGGLLALLLGTGFGRRVAGPLLKIGGIAAVGTIGYNAYRKWQANQNSVSIPGESIDKLTDESAQARSLLLIRAMIAAANADGHIDERERSAISSRIQGLEISSEDRQLLLAEIDHPLSGEDLAKQADSIIAKSEVYLTSLLLVDEQDTVEREYLNSLAQALGLPWELVKQLEAEASAAT